MNFIRLTSIIPRFWPTRSSWSMPSRVRIMSIKWVYGKRQKHTHGLVCGHLSCPSLLWVHFLASLSTLVPGFSVNGLPILGESLADAYQVMESFDMFLNGNFVALPVFQERYGVLVSPDKWAIPTRWQSALFQSGQCGAFVGVFLAGPVTNRLGYRWTTILALILMNATIFISFFVSNSLHCSAYWPNKIDLG